MSLMTGSKRIFPQGKGSDIQLKVFGDEFYARYETLDGYTVTFDTDFEVYCYSVLAGGHLVSSGVPATQDPPAGLVRHLQEKKKVRNKKFEQLFKQMRPDPVLPPGMSGTFGANRGLLHGTPLSGERRVRGLTIMINFRDVKTNITREQVEELLNRDDYREHGNYCSVKKYFKLMSSDRLEYTNLVVGPVTLRHSRAYYISHPCMREALDLAMREYNVDLSQFDSLNRRVVDAVNFVYAGRTLPAGELWPHNWSMDYRGGYSQNGVKVDLYTIQSVGMNPQDLKIGTFCHEAGHLICRFPDLYDYGNRDGDSDPSAGLGKYCLMASGNHLNQGRSPAPICAYLRHLANWTPNVHVLNGSGTFQVTHGDYNAVYKYFVPDRPNEYFLIENRTRMELDKFCASSGLAVYHCDTQGSNEWQGGTLAKHYQCALIQADGARHLENDRNHGDSTDLFKRRSGVALSHDTLPSSKAWGGVESGLILSDIDSPGNSIEFTVGISGKAEIQTLHPGDEVKEKWNSDTTATHRNGCYAKYYTFTLEREGFVQVDLISDTDTYLYLLEGKDTRGDVLLDDDDSGQGYNSRIKAWLTSGTYTIEATTYAPGRQGEFEIHLHAE